MIGKLQRVPLREVWRHEALDFTVWLQDNLDVLNNVLDITLANAEREQSAGTFSVDLVAEDQDGGLVVIENQLGKSDHDHLGKLITYLTAVGAQAAIWIVADPRPEHVTAVSWLNEASSANFYLLKVEAVRIGESPAAPLLTLITGPSAEGKEIGATKKEFAERHALRLQFWSELLEKAKTQTRLHEGISASRYHWVGKQVRPGFVFSYVVREHDASVELYIDRGRDREEENKLIFDSLFEQKDVIEASFGVPLDWQRLDGKRACRIAYPISVGGYRDEGWSELQDAMIAAMIRLEHALKPTVMKLRVG